MVGADSLTVVEARRPSIPRPLILLPLKQNPLHKQMASMRHNLGEATREAEALVLLSAAEVSALDSIEAVGYPGGGCTEAGGEDPLQLHYFHRQMCRSISE